MLLENWNESYKKGHKISQKGFIFRDGSSKSQKGLYYEIQYLRFGKIKYTIYKDKIFTFNSNKILFLIL
jgi:hypothetical protein